MTRIFMAALVMTLVSCVVDSDEVPGVEIDGKGDGVAQSPLGAEARDAWRAYVAELANVQLQPGCRPFMSTLPPGVDYRGVALLFHGYTACPQQFDEVSKALAARGIVVLAPTLPGHGRVPLRDSSGAAVDQVSSLPRDDDFAAYTRFAVKMHGILSKANGVRVVGGISVGGAIAARVAAHGDAADRVWLANSFFDAAGVAASLLAPANALAPDYRHSWGTACEAERARGRAGYCQFLITNLRAVQRFGTETAGMATRVKARTQILGVEDDASASSPAIAAYGRNVPMASTCFFRAGVSHSLLSRYDNPDEPKPWIPATILQLVRFAADGAFFREDGASTIAGFPRCLDR